MGEVIPFRKRSGGPARPENRMLCRSGFHRWVVIKDSAFDVKEGKLVTVYRCQRCGTTRTEAR